MSRNQQQAQPEQPAMKAVPVSNSNPFGIGADYRDVTCAISSTARVVSASVSGLNAVATKFETQQWVSNAEFAVETCNKFGVTNNGVPLTMVEASSMVQQLVAQLRGY